MGKAEKLALGSDHAGFLLKEQIIDYLKEKQIEYTDFGCFSENSVDYPDFAHLVAREVNAGNYKTGILICGSGNGVNITANKYLNVRSALCWNDEIAKLARLHNDANILCLPGRFITVHEAIAILDSFLNTEFEGGRHQRRVEKISQLQ